MTAKEKADTCHEQARQAYQAWNDRRGYEWKFTVGLWTVLVVADSFLVKEATIAGRWFGWMELLVFLMYVNWLYGLWRSNEFDIQTQRHFQRQARILLRDSNHIIEDFKYSRPDCKEFRRDCLSLDRIFKNFIFHYSHLTYCVMTGLLLVIMFLFTSGGVVPRSDAHLVAIEETTRTSQQSLQTCLDQIRQLRLEVERLRVASERPSVR